MAFWNRQDRKKRGENKRREEKRREEIRKGKQTNCRDIKGRETEKRICWNNRRKHVETLAM